MKIWLMKSEPDVYSIDDLKRDKSTLWEGVRNYQARNFMMRDMAVGDQVLFYHSNAEPSGIAGLGKVVAPACADTTATNRRSEYFDPRATKADPRWFCVKVGYVKKWPQLVPLSALRQVRGLEDMLVLRKGQRLSIQPVTDREYALIINLAANIKP